VVFKQKDPPPGGNVERQGELRFGPLQLLHQRGGGEKPCGAIQPDQAAADARGQVGFAHATGAEQQQVLRPVEPAAVVGQLLDLWPVQIRVGVPVEVGQPSSTLFPMARPLSSARCASCSVAAWIGLRRVCRVDRSLP